MRNTAATLLAAFALLAVPLVASAQTTQPTQADLEKQFEQEMTNATLHGSYTATGKDQPGADQYTILKVTKADGDNWVFTARIEFAGKNLELPLTLPVKWAGDTPVIEVSDMWVPGLGTYTARVVIYKGQYAGTWSGKGHGGQLWGKIEHVPATTQPVVPVK